MHTEAHPGLAGIPLVVEARPMVHVDTGNVPLLLHELRHALERLLTEGTTHVIDLRAIPLGPGEEERLLETLGTGEMRAEFNSLGRSVIEESSYPGLWRVTHWNTTDEITGRFLEVAFTPALLSSPPEDVSAGLARLTAVLDG
jgi:HupH hydrogenase expression protein, C-terminal conserved region